MAIEDLVGDFILRPILEILLYIFGFGTGYVVLSVLSFGNLKLAPFSKLSDFSRKKRKKGKRFTIWLNSSKHNRVLHSDVTLVVGLIFWACVGVITYYDCS